MTPRVPIAYFMAFSFVGTPWIVDVLRNPRLAAR
jgi:hypothetical protein